MLAPITAAGLLLAASQSSQPSPARAGDERATARPSSSPTPRPAGGATPDGGEDRGKDDDIVRHLEELENLDLLMHLEAFDEKDGRR